MLDQRGYCTILKDMLEDLYQFKREGDQSEEAKTGYTAGFISSKNKSMTSRDPASMGIHLNSVVTKVVYSSDGVSVHCINSETNNEITFKGDFVISTVSVGVLKSGDIKFDPPLPPWKKKALGEVDMGHFCKVYLNFS